MGNCFSYKYYDIKKDKNNKVIYEGSFKKKKKHGYGIEYKNQKKKYDNQWTNNNKFGCGTLFDNNENIYYTSEFLDNKKDCIGTEKHNNYIL